jgi:hypothetical protein
VSDSSAYIKIIDKLDQYEVLSVLERKDLLLDIQKVAELHLEPEVIEPDSVCPVTKQEVIIPCQLTQCRYWVEHQWTKNCALNFMASQEVDQLSVEQVSFLYRKSVERVNSIYNRSFKVLQRHYLRDMLRNKGVPQFSFVPGFCVSCQSKLWEEDLADGNLRLTDQFGYCSVECKKQLPPQYFEIEHFFQADFYEIVKLGSELFNFYYLEDILGFQPNVLRNRLEKLRDSSESNDNKKKKKKAF